MGEKFVYYSSLPLAFVPDVYERRVAQTSIFTDIDEPSGPSIERYGVTHLVALGPPPEHLASLGTVVALTDGYYAVVLVSS